jgi:uncharacterized protein YjbI with pentapeptide repeats
MWRLRHRRHWQSGPFIPIPVPWQAPPWRWTIGRFKRKLRQGGSRWGMAGPDDTNANALPYPIWGFGPPSPEPDTKKLDALLASLNVSAERFQTLWFSFLGLTLYLAIAALTTTHRNLLLSEPQVLPILNIKVELLPFYVIAPLLYLVFHFYLLMMLALLARTAAEFDKQLRTTLPVEPEQERYRAQVENALFLQLLVGMKGERIGFNALLMAVIAFITTVLAPLATLVLVQMMFLPYHHLRITWWHRAIVVADLVLIMLMTYRCVFPRGIEKAPLVLGALSRKPRWAVAMAFWLLLAVALGPVVGWLSFREGRWAGEPMLSFSQWRWWSGEAPPFAKSDRDYAATAHGVVFGLFPDRLKINDKAIVGETKLEEARKEIASRGGDFVMTIKLDYRDLQAADLREADLRGVDLNRSAIQGANLKFSHLEDAGLIDAQLQGANVEGARLEGANLSGAQLQYANLGGAQLQGAELQGAQLQGAYLRNARLQGAELRDAQLQGTDLSSAQLQGADLLDAHVQGTDLYRAQLQGANLTRAHLQAANLFDAQLQGANIYRAQLQGADLSRADLADSRFVGTFVFRADSADSILTNVAVRSVHVTRVKDSEESGSDPELTPADVDAWIAAATEFAPADRRDVIVRRFDRLKKAFGTAASGAGGGANWHDLEDSQRSSDPNGDLHRQALAKFLGELACEPDGAPFVAHGLIQNGSLEELGNQLDDVRKRMKEGRDRSEACKGVVGLSDRDWRALDAIKSD